jgi:hypothetical protein
MVICFPRLRAAVGRWLRFRADRIDREHAVVFLTGAYFNIVPGKGLVITATDGLRAGEDRGVPLMFQADKYAEHAHRTPDDLAPLERGEWRAWDSGHEPDPAELEKQAEKLSRAVQRIVLPAACTEQRNVARRDGLEASNEGSLLVSTRCRPEDHAHESFFRAFRSVGDPLWPKEAPAFLDTTDPTALTPYVLARVYNLGALTRDAFVALAAAWDYPPADRTDGHDSLVLEVPGEFGATIGRAFDEGLIDHETHDAVLEARAARA